MKSKIENEDKQNSLMKNRSLVSKGTRNILLTKKMSSRIENLKRMESFKSYILYLELIGFWKMKNMMIEIVKS